MTEITRRIMEYIIGFLRNLKSRFKTEEIIHNIEESRIPMLNIETLAISVGKYVEGKKISGERKIVAKSI